MENKICPICESWFSTKDENKIYCSRYCYNHQKKICDMCGIEFISNSYNQKVCKSCKPELIRQQRNRPTLKICKNCWEEFEWSPRRTTCQKCINGINSKKAYKLIEAYNKLPEIDKQKKREKIKQATKMAIDNVDINKWDERQNKKSISLKQYYANMSKEEYEAYHNNLVKKAEERYKKTWCMWPVQQPEVIAAINNSSKEEKKWEDAFIKIGFDIDNQFVLWKYRYDLKIWNTLIEVNPFPFHNSTFAPKKENAKPKHWLYHYNKTKYAIDNWYNIINIRDRTNSDEVISLLNKQTYINKEPTLHRYNPKTKEHIIDDWYGIEEMINKWFVEIRDWWEFYSIK